MLSPADSMIQSHYPTCMVPIEGPFRALREYGHRFLAAADGLWIELRHPWIHVVVPLARANLPYGQLREQVELLCGPLPPEFLQRFRQQAIDALPNETAAFFLWSPSTRRWRYAIRPMSCATPDLIEFAAPLDLMEDELLVLDIHSHGTAHAHFSLHADDPSDFGEVKLAMVLGRVHPQEPGDVVVRLCLPNGHFHQLTFKGVGSRE